jgi:hypothetical protein
VPTTTPSPCGVCPPVRSGSAGGADRRTPLCTWRLRSATPALPRLGRRLRHTDRCSRLRLRWRGTETSTSSGRQAGRSLRPVPRTRCPTADGTSASQPSRSRREGSAGRRKAGWTRCWTRCWSFDRYGGQDTATRFRSRRPARTTTPAVTSGRPRSGRGRRWPG